MRAWGASERIGEPLKIWVFGRLLSEIAGGRWMDEQKFCALENFDPHGTGNLIMRSVKK